MTKSENPPAFPRSAFTSPQNAGDHFPHHEQDGMTLRDYFAAKCLPEIIREIGPKDKKLPTADVCQAMATLAYIFADCMLSERSKS